MKSGDQLRPQEEVTSAWFQKFAPVLTQVAGRTYMSAEGLAGYPKFPA
jgi:hypothetical protein